MREEKVSSSQGRKEARVELVFASLPLHKDDPTFHPTRNLNGQTASKALTVLDEQDHLFWHQAQGQSEEDVLLGDSREGSSEGSTDVVLDS